MPSFKSVLARIGGATPAEPQPAAARSVAGVAHVVPGQAAPTTQPAAPLPNRRDATRQNAPQHAPANARSGDGAHPAPNNDAARRQLGTSRLKAMFSRPGGHHAAPNAAPAARAQPGASRSVASSVATHVQAATSELSTPFHQRISVNRPIAASDYVTGGARYAADPKASHAEALRRRAGRKAGAALSGALPAVPEDDHEDADEQAMRIESLDSPDALRTQVDVWFPEPAGVQRVNGGDNAVLAGRLAGLGAPDAAPSTQRGALLAIALRSAGATSSVDARAILDEMSRLDFSQMDQATSANPAGAAQPLDETRARAWLAARNLSRTEEGFDALQVLRGPRPDDTPLRINAQRTMLEAADHADPGPHDALTLANDPAPGAVQARNVAAGGTPRLATRAFSAAATANTHGVARMSAAHKGDFFAWRQHYREDGPGTPLAKTRSRLHKFTGKALDQAGETRWKTFAARSVGKHRAPLAALRSGTQDVTRATIAKEQKSLAKLAEHRGALLDRPMMQPAATLGHDRPGHSIAELAALHVWFDQGGFKTGQPDAAQTKLIVAKANEMRNALATADLSATPELIPARDAMLRDTAGWSGRNAQQDGAFRTLGVVPFNANRIADWVQRAGVEDADFIAAVDTLKSDTKNLPQTVATPAQDGVVNALSEVVKTIPSGARLRMQDGNRFGFSTRGLSANLGKLLSVHGVPIQPRVDIRAAGNRSALVEFARSNYGSEIFMGTAKGISAQAGLGVRVGYDFDVGLSYVRAGVTTQAVLHQQERNEPSGVSLRVARRVLPDGSNFDDRTLETKYAALFQHLVQSSATARTGNEGDTWNRLADQFLEDPDISVGWTDGIDHTIRHGATVDVGVYGGIPKTPLSAGIGVGAGYTATRRHTREVHDDAGALQVEQHRSGSGARWVARLTGGLSGSVSLGPKAHDVSMGLSSIDTPSAILALSDSGIESRVQIARDNGKLVPRSCLVDVEYKSAETFTHAVDAQAGAWRDLYALKSLKEQGVDVDTATPAHWATAHAAADTKINTLLGDARANSAPNQTFFHRFRLRDSAARQIDALTASDSVHGQPTASVARRIDDIMTNPASWIASDLKVKEQNSITTRSGLNAGLIATSVTQVSGEHEIVSESADFADLDKLERYQERQAAEVAVPPAPPAVPAPPVVPAEVRQQQQPVVPPAPTHAPPPIPTDVRQQQQPVVPPAPTHAPPPIPTDVRQQQRPVVPPTPTHAPPPIPTDVRQQQRPVVPPAPTHAPPPIPTDVRQQRPIVPPAPRPIASTSQQRTQSAVPPIPARSPLRPPPPAPAPAIPARSPLRPRPPATQAGTGRDNLLDPTSSAGSNTASRFQSLGALAGSSAAHNAPPTRPAPLPPTPGSSTNLDNLLDPTSSTGSSPASRFQSLDALAGSNTTARNAPPTRPASLPPTPGSSTGPGTARANTVASSAASTATPAARPPETPYVDEDGDTFFDARDSFDADDEPEPPPRA
ncbi:MAG: autotransporter [Burkholderia sp.]